MPTGGFDLTGGLEQAMRLMQYMDVMKKRRLEQENPLPGFSKDYEAEAERVGAEGTVDPEYVRELQRLHGMSGDDPRVEAYTKGYKSKAKQARMQQARKHIADMVNEIAQAEAQANTMTGVFSQDPRYASIMGPIIKSNRERLYKANRRALELAYPDLINDSEFHEMMQQSMVDSVMGPTEPGGLSQQGLSATGSDPTAAMSQYGPYSQGYAMPGGDYPRQQAGSPTSNYWQTIRRGIGR